MLIFYVVGLGPRFSIANNSDIIALWSTILTGIIGIYGPYGPAKIQVN